MKLTIVTVCYNAKDTLKATLDSVVGQTYEDVQYVIVDGASTDGSVELIEGYARADGNITFVSEPDTGIYDAMNKGVKYADGDYVFFLNAGDVFTSENTLKDFAELAADGKDIYYGDVSWGGEIRTYPDSLSLFRLIWMERMVCHQTIFAKKCVLEKHPFDLSYKIDGDRVWLIDSLKDGASFRHLGGYVPCVYDLTGVSSTSEKFYEESLRIGREYGGSPAVLFIKVKRLLGKLLKK